MEEQITLRSLIAHIAEGRWWNGDWIRLSVALLTSMYFLFVALTPGAWHFMDFVNLLIYEAGHMIFIPFGEFMHILGGSLFQVVFPMLYIGYFYLRRDYFSASLLVFWVGENLINVSVYASDAVAMQLPLLGEDASGHDWHNILGMLHLLHATGAIGFSIYIAGAITILAGVVLSIGASQRAHPYAI